MAKACVISRGKRKGKLKKGWRFNKAGNCVKKKRKKPCKRVKRQVDGVTVALPCRAKSLSTAMRNRLDDTFTQASWTGCKKKAGCRVVFFTATKPVMRKPGRKLKSKAPGTKGRPMPCVNKKGKIVKCGRKGAKRMRKAR